MQKKAAQNTTQPIATQHNKKHNISLMQVNLTGNTIFNTMQHKTQDNVVQNNATMQHRATKNTALHFLDPNVPAKGVLHQIWLHRSLN